MIAPSGRVDRRHAASGRTPSSCLRHATRPFPSWSSPSQYDRRPGRACRPRARRCCDVGSRTSDFVPDLAEPRAIVILRADGHAPVRDPQPARASSPCWTSTLDGAGTVTAGRRSCSWTRSTSTSTRTTRSSNPTAGAARVASQGVPRFLDDIALFAGRDARAGAARAPQHQPRRQPRLRREELVGGLREPRVSGPVGGRHGVHELRAAEARPFRTRLRARAARRSRERRPSTCPTAPPA